jgi:pimeloyl-ACP methyl ester carboxylesterase
MAQAHQTLRSNSFFSTLYYEYQAGKALVVDSLHGRSYNYSFSSRTQVKRRSVRYALVLPGFGAPRFVYNDLVDELREHNIHAEVAHYTPFDLFRRSLSNLERNVDRFLESFGRLDFIIGHSLGGNEAVLALSYCEQIERVVAVASPFRGISHWRFLGYAEKYLIVPEPLERRHVRKTLKISEKHGDKIITVASPYDKVSPPEEAALPGANNILLSDEEILKSARKRSHREKESVYNSHTGLLNSRFVRGRVLSALHL